MKFTYAAFPGRASAERAVAALLDASIDPRQIRVIARTARDIVRVPLDRYHGMTPAIVTGAVLGALAGLFAGGIGAAAEGHVALIGAGGVVGACLGALLGALAMVGRWRLLPKYPNDLCEADGIIVGALTLPRRVQTVADALRRSDGHDMEVGLEVDPIAAAHRLLAAPLRPPAQPQPAS